MALVQTRPTRDTHRDIVGRNGFLTGNFAVDGNAEIDGTLTTNGALATTGSVTATTSFIIGSADLNEADLEKLDGITNGTAAASKAVVADASVDVTGLRNLTITGSYIIGSASMSEADLEQLDDLTAGTVTASRAVVVDASKHIGTFGQVRGTRFIPQPGALTAIDTAGNVTYTIAQLLTGCIVRDPNGGARTDTLPTAADLVAGITGVAVGDVIACYFVNAADAAEAVTLDAGANGAYDAKQTATSRAVPQFGSKWIFIRVTNITGASEAYTVAF